MDNNNSTNGRLRMIVQAGAVGICVLLIALFGYQLKLNNEKDKRIMDHLSESTAVIKENTRVQEQVKSSVDRLVDLLRYPSSVFVPGGTEDFE